jgi:hypothetical protein
MLGFNAATRLHRQAMTWAEGILKLGILEDELQELEKRKAIALIEAQTRLANGSLRASHLQTLVELTSKITSSQWQLLGQYQHNVLVQCMNIPSSKHMQPTESSQAQQTTTKYETKKTTARKRKASHDSGQSHGQGLPRTQLRPLAKNHAISRSCHSGGTDTLKGPKPPGNTYEMPTTRPGILYLVLCGKSELIPAVVLYPGSAEGPFSVGNTDLLSLEKCCSCDQQKNILSCRDTPETWHPVRFLDAEDPQHGDAEWIAAAKLRPLDPTITLSAPYDRRVSQYIQKYWSCVSDRCGEAYIRSKILLSFLTCQLSTERNTGLIREGSQQ